MDETDLIHRALSVMRSEPRIGAHFHPDLLQLEPDGAVTLAGELDTVGPKRLALERPACVPGIVTIIDRLRVAPPSP